MMKHLKVLSLCLIASILGSTLSGCNNLEWSDVLKELEKIDFAASISDWTGINHYGTAYGSYPYKKLNHIFTGKSIRPDKNDEEGNRKDILDLALHPDEADIEKSKENGYDGRAKEHDKDDYGECDYSLEFEYFMSPPLKPDGKDSEKFAATGLGYYIITSKTEPDELDTRYDEGAKCLPNGLDSSEIDCYFQYQHVSNDRNYDDLIYYPEGDKENYPELFNYEETFEDIKKGFSDYFAGVEGEDDDDSVIARLKKNGDDRKETAVDNVNIRKKSLSWRVVTANGGRYTVTLHHENYRFNEMVLDYKKTSKDEDGNPMEITARCIYEETDWTMVRDYTWTKDEG